MASCRAAKQGISENAAKFWFRKIGQRHASNSAILV
jgi:hypothetical protein